MRSFKNFAIGLAVALACLQVNTAKADAAAAQADFSSGQKFQAAKQWGPAVKAYQQTLKDDPNAYWAYKALGTTYYLAGDRRGAVAYYNRYLSIHPADTATQAFNERLKASLGQGATPAAPAPAAAPVQDKRDGFSVRLEGGLVLNSGADVAALYSGPDSSASVPGGMAATYGLGVDYALKGGFIGGVDIIDGPLRGYAVSFSGESGVVNWSIGGLGFLLTPGWNFKVGPHWSFQPRLGLGYMSSSINVTDSEGGPATTATASGIAIWPQFRGERLFGSWGIGFNLGYLIASFSPVNTSDGKPIQQVSSTGSESNWSLQNGGLSSGFFVSYHFN
jgi:hypothetical protein